LEYIIKQNERNSHIWVKHVPYFEAGCWRTRRRIGTSSHCIKRLSLPNFVVATRRWLLWWYLTANTIARITKTFCWQSTAQLYTQKTFKK